MNATKKTFILSDNEGFDYTFEVTGNTVLMEQSYAGERMAWDVVDRETARKEWSKCVADGCVRIK